MSQAARHLTCPFMNREPRTRTSKTAFSIVELIVVIAVIGVVAAIAIPAMTARFNPESRPKPALPKFIQSDTTYTITEVGESKSGQAWYRLENNDSNYLPAVGKTGHSKGEKVKVLVVNGATAGFRIIAENQPSP